MGFGYSTHGLPYRDTLIYMVGGRGNAVMAFAQADGKVRWKALDDANSPSSPILINVDGQQQIVGVFSDYIVGFSPNGGREFWRHPHREPNCSCNISTPIWAPGNILFVGTAYGLGARALEIHQTAEKSTVKELWSNRRLQLHFGSAILKDGYIYVSVGHDGPALMTAVELKTGTVKYQDRGLSKAQLVYADGKFFMTDQQGMIALGRGTPEKFTVLSQFEGLKNISWTAPTIAGTKMYVRDRLILTAYDVGK